MTRVRRIVAVHEAAHALVWERMGVPVSHCSLLTLGLHTSGETVLIEPNVPRAKLAAAAAGLVAGEIAERRAWIKLARQDAATAADMARAGAAADRQLYVRDLGRLSRQDAERRAEELVVRHWRRILSLARVLERDGRLERKRIQRRW
jgi:hypothetical protein